MVLANYFNMQSGKQIHFATLSLRNCSKAGVINISIFWIFVLMIPAIPTAFWWGREDLNIGFLYCQNQYSQEIARFTMWLWFTAISFLATANSLCYVEPDRSYKIGKTIMTNQELIYTWNRYKMDVSFYVIGI